jgi:hypothetical protein
MKLFSFSSLFYLFFLHFSFSIIIYFILFSFSSLFHLFFLHFSFFFIIYFILFSFSSLVYLVFFFFYFSYLFCLLLLLLLSYFPFLLSSTAFRISSSNCSSIVYLLFCCCDRYNHCSLFHLLISPFLDCFFFTSRSFDLFSLFSYSSSFYSLTFCFFFLLLSFSCFSSLSLRPGLLYFTNDIIPGFIKNFWFSFCAQNISCLMRLNDWEEKAKEADSLIESKFYVNLKK